MKRRNLPITPEVVAQRAAAIRATWTPEERERRRVRKPLLQPVSVMRVKISDICSDASQEFLDEMVGWEYLENSEIQQHNQRIEDRHHKLHPLKEECLNGDEIAEYVEAVIVNFGEKISERIS